MRVVVVVGASLAGLRAVETLRSEGFDGRLVLVGAEDRLPYDRPPLSKEVLTDDWDPRLVVLRAEDDYGPLHLDLRLGCRATSLDLADRVVKLDTGEGLRFDGLVVATGCSPRSLPGTPDLDGIHFLRTLDDSLAIRAALDHAARAVVVGAGFIGSEVAASCARRGLSVTVLEALPVPLERALGAEMGAACARLHRDHGVDLRTHAAVAGFRGEGRVEQVELVDGTTVAADLVVVGVGVTPNTAWLEGSGLTLDNGVVADATCTAAPGVVVAGDVCRWHNDLYDVDMRVEHWTNAAEQGVQAARNLLRPDAAERYAPVPYFWSDQYDAKIQFVGHVGPGDEVRVVNGSVEERRFVAVYGRGGRVVGALAIGFPRLLMAYRRLIAQRATWDDALALER